MPKLNYLNAGCGFKFHKDWVNIDQSSFSPHVQSANILRGLPFPDNHFDVVYHSQVIEHFNKEKGMHFMLECARVLKPGGRIRVVTPDLENIVSEYQKFLHQNLENPTEQTVANYDWILLELYDQMVRNYSGGEMADFIRKPVLVNEDYVFNRIGYVGKFIRNEYIHPEKNDPERMMISSSLAKRIIGFVKRRIVKHLTTKNEKLGAFRNSGEIHFWLYDRYSLGRMLMNCGLGEVEVKNAFESNIPDWSTYSLDVKEGQVYDPCSLFMEATKDTGTSNVQLMNRSVKSNVGRESLKSSM